jgi:hypothetical protein
VVRRHKAAIPVLLKALDDEDGLVRTVAYESLLRVTSEQEARKALRDSSLSQLGVSDEFMRLLYGPGYEGREARKAAMEAISRHLDGRALPGKPWKPVRSQEERDQRRRQVVWIAAAAPGLVALLLGVAWLSGVPPFNSVLAPLGGAIALIASLAGLAGVTLRDLLTHRNRNADQKRS